MSSALSSPLSERLRARIATAGPITFHDFMAAALYDAEHGYYASGRAAIGRGGDFITNVSVGRLFGRLLSRQFAEMWERAGAPTRFVLVEQGANDGRLAADVLEAIRLDSPGFFRSVEYWIVEPFDALRRAQETVLDGFGKIRWHASVDQLPDFEGILYSNELLDAFPVHLVRRHAGKWCERCVGLNPGGELEFCDGSLSGERLEAFVSSHLPLVDSYQTEVKLNALDWVAAVSARLIRGWVLLIDYGYTRSEYYRAERVNGTLSAYRRHQRVANPLDAPGDVDLTAHVEFTSVAEAAIQHGLRPCGFTDQHHFVTGIAPLYFSKGRSESMEAASELRQFKTLMHPNLLGGRFNALCLERDVANGTALAGFRYGPDALAALELSPAAG